LNPHG